MVYQVILECNNYCGTPSDLRCNSIGEYLKQKLSDTDSIEMRESQVVQNIVRPQIIIHCNDKDPSTLIKTLDEILLEIGLYALKAVIVKIATRATEGIILGGIIGPLLSKNENKLLASLIGALIGGGVGNLIEKQIIEFFVADKQLTGWKIQKFSKR